MCWSGLAPTPSVSPLLLPGNPSDPDAPHVLGISLPGTASSSLLWLALLGNCSITNSQPMPGPNQLECSWLPPATFVVLTKNLLSLCFSFAPSQSLYKFAWNSLLGPSMLALLGNCSITNSKPMLGPNQLECSWLPPATSVVLTKNLLSLCFSSAPSQSFSRIGFRLKVISSLALPALSPLCGTPSQPTLAIKPKRAWEPSSSLPSSAFGRLGIRQSSTVSLLL